MNVSTANLFAVQRRDHTIRPKARQHSTRGGQAEPILPRKHHYVPVCYLKQWANTGDRRLCEHKLIPGGYGVKPRRTSPDGTGYQVDLYRIEGVPEDIAQDFEKRFMHLVDTDASRALEKVIAGDNWPGPLRSGWTRFISRCCFAIPRR
jgi:hypothetical protein